MHVSKELALIINLSNAALFHKAHCMHEDCNTALYQLREAASYIAVTLKVMGYTEEYEEALRIVKEMPIT